LPSTLHHVNDSPVMTNLGTFILVTVCVGMGYIIEPIMFELRNRDRNKSESVEQEPKAKKKKDKPKPKPKQRPSVDIDLSLVKPVDFPDQVSLYQTYEIDQDGLTLSLKEGVQVTPVRLDGSELIFKSKGMTLEHVIDVDQTDFKQLVLPVMNARIQREAELKRIEDAKPVVLDDAAILSCVQASVESGAVNEFKTEQVTEWLAGEDMDFDGATYQTGLITFEAETILGKQSQKAIALIEDGEVVKWIWAKTSLEMR
jgi:hypothetical protein